MVIVDVRPETVGIPTDAYFAVEEIKDVRIRVSFWSQFVKKTLRRMEQRQEKLSSTSPQQLKPRKLKKLVSNTFSAISKTPPPQPSPPV
jgi:hypothetical protein